MFVDIVRLNEYTVLIRKVYIISYLAKPVKVGGAKL